VQRERGTREWCTAGPGSLETPSVRLGGRNVACDPVSAQQHDVLQRARETRRAADDMATN
jgi:hypothetical protein